MSNKNRNRPAAVLFAVVAVMVIASLLLFAWMRSTLRQHQVVRGQEISMQADWLLESALARAASRFTSKPAYTGEEWRIEDETLAAQGAALATIVVNAADEADANNQADRQTKISVLVTYPLESRQQVRREKEITVSRN